MAKMLAMYTTPRDAAFDSHYRDVHVPLVKKIPGLARFELSAGPIQSPSDPSGIHLIATLHFPDMQTMQRAFASPEAQAAVADSQAFMRPEDSILLFYDSEV